MRLALSSLFLVGAVAVAWAANPKKPHPHHGVLKPYTLLPPPSLDEKDKAALRAGQAVRRQTEGEAGGRGMAVFLVGADPETTWGVLNDFGSYPKWIDNVDKCEVYRRDGENIDVEFVLAGMGFSVRYYIHHVYRHAERWGSWTLDYSRESDLDDSVGFWRVTPWAEDPSKSLVEYSVDVQVRGWVPGFIRSIFVDKGLKQATQWVKVQSEKRAGARK